MRIERVLAVVAAVTLCSPVARADEAGAEAGAVESSKGDLFPGERRMSVSGATGLPFLAIAEVGVGVTDGFAIGAIGGITPSVVTAGIRPRVRLRTSERTALVLSAPMLYYPKASAPGPGNIGTTSWVLTRTELFFDAALSDRLRVAGGMGFIAAASTEALGQFVRGRDFAMPAYNGEPGATRGFAGGLWNTVAARSSYAFGDRTHVFAEGSIVMQGIALAEGVGGPPVVVTTGLQHAF
ncbi:hypothetical protein [Labilithrix luteola]|nr:hypothetical protein [Labilithrix luteola]